MIDGERKADQGRGERAAENDDRRMFADEHVQIAAHQNHEADDADTGRQAKTCRNIHNATPRTQIDCRGRHSRDGPLEP